MPSDNSSKASEFFSSKEEYNNSYPFSLKQKSYDIWNNVPYYGKIDTMGRAVFPREAVLVNLDDKAQYQAVNFVADAFLSLQNFVKIAKSKGAFKSDFFGKFAPKKAWEPLPTLFDQYFEDHIYDQFLNNYLSTKTISNFKCFVVEYLNFARAISKDGALTAVGFALSNNCPSRISGLILDLAPDEHDDFETKVTDYLDDQQYLNFVNACKAHGFRINKNAPWQIIADLSNEQMKNYANKYNVSLKDNKLFDTYYLKTSSIGYYNFKSYLWQMYSDWYAVNSTHSKIQVEVKFNASSPMFSVFETNKIDGLPVEPSMDLNSFFQKYGEIYFLKLYLRTRLIECGREEDYKHLEKYLVVYYDLPTLKSDKIQTALKFIDIKLNKSAIYTSEKFIPYYFQLDKKENKGIMGIEDLSGY